jgi:hypothetical protein
VISVGDAINEPRYPSLKAIMGAKKKPLENVTAGDVGIDASLVGADGSRVQCGEFHDPAGQGGRADHRGRGHQRDGREDRRLARRKEADLDGRHPDLRPPLRGRFQQELARAVSEGAKRPPRSAARPRGRRRRRRPDRRAVQTLGSYGATKVFRAKGPRGSRSRSST